MGLKLFSINHRDHDLAAVEVLSPLAQADLETRLTAADSIDGCVVLATCNRIEILIDTPQLDAATSDVRTTLAQATAVGPQPPIQAREYQGEDLITHLCELACGLESMVVGEREITGQLRYAARRARRLETITPALADAIDAALKAARLVEKETGLSGMGRSVAAVALSHVEALIGDYRQATVTLFGTGSYAGAVVTQLQARGCERIFVHSNSGRAQAFAAGRELTAVSNAELGAVLARSDLIISCRGIGSPTVTFNHLQAGMRAQPHRPRPLVILDLAVVRDVDPQVGHIPGVELVDLEAVRSLVPELAPEVTERARAIAREVAGEYQQLQAARLIDPVIVSMRRAVQELVEDELAHLPKRALEAADVERALRRLTNRILHHPTIAAKAAGAAGSAADFVAALELLTGINSDTSMKEKL